MSYFQIIILALIGIIIFKIFKKYKTSVITIREFFLWTALWLGGAAMTAFPNATQTIARLVGIGRGVDLIIYTTLTILFLGLFYVIVRLERIEKDITKIIRKTALKNANHKS